MALRYRSVGVRRGLATIDDLSNAPRTGYVETNGARIYYEVHGDPTSGKTPLLVLHGSYMSADSMAPLVGRFAATRPVIAISQRGHGRSGDVAGGITYELLADDAAGVLEALRVEAADVLGYSMGGNVALLMAIRHSARVRKQVIVAGTYRRDGYYPVVLRALESVTPEFFAGGPMERDYKRLSPTREAFRPWSRSSRRWTRRRTTGPKRRSARSKERRWSSSATPTASGWSTPSNCSSCAAEATRRSRRKVS